MTVPSVAAAGDLAGTAPVTQAAVLGAGLMGAGIAQLLIEHHVTTTLYDPFPQALDRGMRQVHDSLRRLARAERLREPADVVENRLRPTTDLTRALVGSEAVLESIPEDLSRKIDLFGEIEPQLEPGTLIATNTSQLPITELAAQMRHPCRFLGLHFFNPPPMRRLIEVIPGLLTSDQTTHRGTSLAHAMGCETVLSRDVQGFIASRANIAYQLESYRIYESGVASAEDIDKTFRLGFDYPIGPLELADYVGLDTILRAADALHAAYGERFRPPQILRRLVAAGRLGRKTDAGFYDYPA